MGDRILNVNGVDIRGASHQDAVMALLVKADQMKITVQHDPLPSGFKVKQIKTQLLFEYWTPNNRIHLITKLLLVRYSDAIWNPDEHIGRVLNV